MTTGADRWAAAPDLPSLAELCIEWLNGETDATPACNGTPIYEGGPCEDMKAIAPYLIALNRAGLVTCNAEDAWIDGTDEIRQGAWVEGFASGATVTRLREVIAEAGLEMTALSWTDPAWDHITADWDTWVGACPKAASALRAARFVTVEDPRPGRPDVLWAALERFARSGQVTA